MEKFTEYYDRINWKKQDPIYRVSFRSKNVVSLFIYLKYFDLVSNISGSVVNRMAKIPYVQLE